MKNIFIESISIKNLSNSFQISYKLNSDFNFKFNHLDYFFEGDIKNSDFSLNGDAAVVALLPYCMENKINLICNIKCSDMLIYNINNYIIPTIAKNIHEYSKIFVTSKTTNKKFKGSLTATGASFGVDSFYTIIKNSIEHNNESNLKLKYLTLFDVGSFGREKNRDEMFEYRKSIVKELACSFECRSLFCKSNIDDFYREFEFEKTHTFRSTSIIFLLQNLFNFYYFSSSFEAKLFKFSYLDPANYELFLFNYLRTETLSFVSCGSECSRLEKVNYISKNDVVRLKLNVCVLDVVNCSKCFKCKRTMLELYLLNELENFKSVFDVDYFHKNFYLYLEYAKKHSNDIDMPDIYNELKKQKLYNTKYYFYLLKRKLRTFLKLLVKPFKNAKNKEK